MNLPLFSLYDKTILVTGASSGIGYEICLLIDRLGGNFIAVARRENLLHDLISKTNQKHSVIVANLSIEEEVNRIVNSVSNIDGIVHAAGIADKVPLKFYKKSSQIAMFDINYISAMLLVNSLSKSKKINKGASIVLVTSIAAHYGSKGNGMYAATKGALTSIARVWAIEMAASRVRVNCVAPGMVRTAINDKSVELLSQEAVDADEKKYPLGYGDPIHVAAPVAFLLSNASEWITGQVLVADGGRTMSV